MAGGVGGDSIRAMSRLPPALRPLWPVAKRLHRLTTRWWGVLTRAWAPALGSRGVPTGAYATSRSTAQHEPDAVTISYAESLPPIRREPPMGDPAGHHSFRDAAHVDLPDPYVMTVRGGTVVGDYAAIITPGRALDAETSEYFGIEGWREHPIFLRPRLPRVEEFDGRLAVLTTRGGTANYYHFLTDVLPRWETLRRLGPEPDALYVSTAARYERELLALAGLDEHRIVEAGAERAVRARELIVPSLPNPREVAPAWVVDWLRGTFPAQVRADLPTRIYLGRGNQPNTRRLVTEDRLWPELEGRGFARIDPGSMSVRDQIDHFAAAEVVVGVHGAALTNLVFARPGAKVLHLFAPTYVKHCFWAIAEEIPGVEYRYLVGEGRQPGPGGMTGVQDDVDLDPTAVLRVVDGWIS